MGHFITTAKFDKTEPNDIAGLLNQLARSRQSVDKAVRGGWTPPELTRAWGLMPTRCSAFPIASETMLPKRTEAVCQRGSSVQLSGRRCSLRLPRSLVRRSFASLEARRPYYRQRNRAAVQSDSHSTSPLANAPRHRLLRRRDQKRSVMCRTSRLVEACNRWRQLRS